MNTSQDHSGHDKPEAGREDDQCRCRRADRREIGEPLAELLLGLPKDMVVQDEAHDYGLGQFDLRGARVLFVVFGTDAAANETFSFTGRRSRMPPLYLTGLRILSIEAVAPAPPGGALTRSDAPPTPRTAAHQTRSP